MKKISGKVACRNRKEIEDGSVVTIQIACIEVLEASAIVLGEVKIDDPKTFPIQFECEYDDAHSNEKDNHGVYAISARIELDGKLTHINETPYLIFDFEARDFLDCIDFYVNSVQN
jgi:uncharacterized lipoprotein YbaY